MRWLLSFALATALPMAAVQAHGGQEESSGWSVEPLAAILLILSITLYCTGLANMTTGQRRAIAPPWRAGCYFGAVGILVLALFSPIDAFADDSFAWHMLQHLLLMLAAAPLLSLANTHLVSIFALPLGPRRTVAKKVSGAPGLKSAANARLSPFTAAALFAAGMWLWHSPKMYDAALADPTLHTIEHLTFLLTSVVFWRMVLHAGDRRLDPGSAILLTVIVGLQANLLAALILLAPEVIYSTYQGAGLVDQQIAALLMFVPASLVFLAATIYSLQKLVRLVREPDHR